ncbi:MAG: hypothetical protein OEZ03_11815 [Alphaproteobacteria bacterium]|nr:hypothetical protein [Alphaproteobacteria bacterium]MDH5558033.1 hypothetical protein [Alphaproteobacteria bacterium]
MLTKDAAAQVVELVQEIQSRLDTISHFYRDHGAEDDLESYQTTAEFVTGYLHQDIMHPILLAYPEFAPDNWRKSPNGQWMRKPRN